MQASRVGALCLYLALLLISSKSYAKAWVQEAGKGYHVQKLLMKLPTISSISEQADIGNRLDLRNKVEEITFENYIEYGLTNKLTLEVQCSFHTVFNQMAIKATPIDVDINTIDILYNKLNMKLGITRSIWNSSSQAVSVYGAIEPGEYLFSDLGEQDVNKKWNVGIGIAYGESFDLDVFKNNFHEIILEAKYYPMLQALEHSIHLKAGIKINDKLTLIIGSYNTLWYTNYNIHPYLPDVLDIIDQSTIKQHYQDYYKDRISCFLNYNETSHLHKLQLGLHHLMTPKHEIGVDLFFEPLERDTSLILSLAHRF